MSSGCTLGKGNLTVKDEGVPKAHFSTKDGKQFKIRLKNLIQNEIDTTVTEENIINYSECLFEKSDTELFDFY
jgi:formylmethanofuran dehydrogenase subunit E